MSALQVTSDDVGGRSRVWKLAPLDPAGAAKAARQIGHPWYRCQALSRAAEFHDGAKRLRLLDLALNAAREQSEPNRIVTVSSWPMRVLAACASERAEQAIRELIEIAAAEPHNLRRANALQALAASVQGSPALLSLVVPELAAAILGGGGRRMDRVIRDTFELVRMSNPELLHRLALHHKANRQQERLLATLRSVAHE